LTIPCPQCKRRLHITVDTAAKHLCCPGCGHVFTIRREPEAPPKQAEPRREAEVELAAPSSPALAEEPAPGAPDEQERPESVAPAPSGLRKRSKLAIAGWALAALAALCVVWVWLKPRPHVLGPYAPYAPGNAEVVLHINREKLRDSALDDIICRAMAEFLHERGIPLGPDHKLDNLEIGLGDIAALFAARSRIGEAIVVLRTTRDLELEDVVRGRHTQYTYRNIPYVRAHIGRAECYVAKPAERTYCLVKDEKPLKDVLWRVSQDEKPKLNPDLGRAINEISSRDHYLAARGRRSRAMHTELKAIAVGFSGRSMINAEVFLFATTKRSAADREGEIVSRRTDELQKLEAELPALTGIARDQAKRALDMLNEVDVSRSDDVVHVHASWKAEDVAEMAKAVEKPGPPKTVTRLGRDARVAFYRVWPRGVPEPPAPPAVLTEADIKRLKKLLDGGKEKDVLEELKQKKHAPEKLKAKAAGLYLGVAWKLRETDAEAARAAWAQALRLDPDLVPSDEKAFLLRILLALRPSEERLNDCLTFRKKFPKSRYKAQVLVIYVGDAAALFYRPSNLHADKDRGYLQKALQDAEELIRVHRDTPDLDVKALQLMQSVAKAAKDLQPPQGVAELQAKVDTRDKERIDIVRQARQLCTALRKAFPDSKQRIEEAKAQVERIIYGNLPPELYEAADRVKGQLKIQVLASPGQLVQLKDKLGAAHVLQVAEGCTAGKFGPDAATQLRKWVANGGVLWVNNDVLRLFSVESGFSTKGEECYPAVLPKPHLVPKVPGIAEGCSRVSLATGVPRRRELSRKGAIPLLQDGSGTAWSLVPYGKGWISNVQPIELSKGDGARFWLNFRHFCLKPPQPPPLPEFVEVATVDQLDEALADQRGTRVLWVRLSQKDIISASREELKGWVSQGGVLWIDTDLARLFKFPYLKTAMPGLARGWVKVPKKIDIPSIFKPLGGEKANYELSSDRIVMLHPVGGPGVRGLIPLLGRVGADGSLAMVVCAIREHDKGLVIYRPAKILDIPRRTAGSSFKKRLRTYSVQEAKRRAAQSAKQAPKK